SNPHWYQWLAGVDALFHVTGVRVAENAGGIRGWDVSRSQRVLNSGSPLITVTALPYHPYDTSSSGAAADARTRREPTISAAANALTRALRVHALAARR